MPSTPNPYPGILHNFSQNPHLVAFEHAGSTSRAPAPPVENLLLFLGGLGDGLLHPHYPSQLAKTLPSTWRLIEIQLSSSNGGWTTSNLMKDADEVALAVSYFRSFQEVSNPDVKIVLMGHSTGSQICMEYLTSRAFFKAHPNDSSTPQSTTLQRPPISGIILQAGISDRESIHSSLSQQAISAANTLAHSMVASGTGSDVMPTSATNNVLGANPSASRWLSLVEDNAGDDYFSSDLPDEELNETFGRVGKGGWPILVLLGAEDEYMPGSVDKQRLVERWGLAVGRAGGTWDKGSGVVLRARHALDGDGGDAVVADVAERLGAFLRSLQS